MRRNDILLQRGMALQAVPLPSLGVSSLDLGRSFNRAALFLCSGCQVSYSAAARGMASPMTPAMRARTMASRSHRDPVEAGRFVEARLIHIEGAVDLDLERVLRPCAGARNVR